MTTTQPAALDHGRPEATQPAVTASSRPFGGRHVDMLRYEDIPPALSEAVRTIVNRHELRTGEPLPRSVAVTSALSGEGVTTVSQVLAALLAQETGDVVCWFDCGWLAPQDGRDDGRDRPDLVEILKDQSRLVPALRSVPDLPNLICLAPRPVPEQRRNSIVRSPEFEVMLELLIEEFDHVIFDVPAVLPHPNTLALMRKCDASLFVVRHRATSVAQVERALAAIHPTPNLGVVLNRFRSSIPGFFRRQLEG